MTTRTPEGTSLLSPYLVVHDAVAAIDFYAKAFGAEEAVRLNVPDTETVMHAEVRIGGATVMLTQENPAWEMKSPQTLGGSPVSIHFYVDDADAAVARAVAAGATETSPVMDMFWGDRMGQVRCPFGYNWSIATYMKDPTPEELDAGARAMMAEMGSG